MRYSETRKHTFIKGDIPGEFFKITLDTQIIH